MQKKPYTQMVLLQLIMMLSFKRLKIYILLQIMMTLYLPFRIISQKLIFLLNLPFKRLDHQTMHLLLVALLLVGMSF